jgi:hypothetical protein
MKRSHVNKIKEIEINMQTNDITWNIVILQKKSEKRINEFGFIMTEKH